MYDFNIELPKEVLFPNKHNSINFEALEGKVILGLMGFAKSGKDAIAKTFIEEYGYQRVAFADNIKKEMNQYLKDLVFLDIQKSTLDYVPLKLEDIDFFTEDLQMKKIIRPYIIWYGETLKKINGKFYWVNRAFEEDGKNLYKIVLSDVRRMVELDIFRNSNEFKKRQNKSMTEAGLTTTENTSINNYGTLLLEVNQFGLTDSDTLTTETIQHAREQWLIDDTFWIDSRIPDVGNARQKSIDLQVKRIATKFGIEKPKKELFCKQFTIYDELKN